MLRELKMKNWIGLLILLLCLAYIWVAIDKDNFNLGTVFLFGSAAIAGGYLFIRGN